MKNLFHRLSAQPINRLLIISFILVSLVPLSVLGFKLYNAAWDSAWREIREKHRLLAMNMASPIRIYIADKRRIMGLLAKSVATNIQRGDKREVIHQQLLDAQSFIPDFNYLALVKVSGNTLSLLRTDSPADTSIENVQSVYANNATFQATRTSSKWSISGVQRSVISGKPTIYMAFPVQLHNQLKAVLVGELKIDEIENLRRNIHFGEKGHSAIVDNFGRALAHPNPQWMAEMKDLSHLYIVQKMLAGESGVTEFYSPFIKEMMVAGYTSIPELGWGIMVPQPKPEVEKQVHALLYAHLSWALFGLALAIVLAILLARWITRPINQLAHAAHSLEINQFEGSLPTITRHAPYELSELSSALHSLVNGLQDSRSEITQLNATLQLRVDEATRQLLETNEKLKHSAALAEQANTAKSAFLANMSHEIRTPLTAIIGYSELLLDSQQSEADRISAVQTVIRSGNHLLNIINDILDLSKVEAEKLEIEAVPVELVPLIRDIEKIALLQAEAKGIDFKLKYEYPLPAQVISDSVRLKQVILNIINNAIKFTQSGSVSLTIKYLPDSQLICFDVIDTGIGISPEQLQKLFQPFTQADVSTTRKFGGTGLGLYLSRMLAQKLGGDITVTSQVNQGSYFSITIAARIPDNVEWINNDTIIQDANETPVSVATTKVSGKVLLVEDNINNQNLFAHFLEKLGAEVDVANNGQAAVDMTSGRQYDLILMDIQMPVMDGLEAVVLLRQKGYTNPIVALTANAMQGDIDKYLAAGFDDYIAKPVYQQDFNQTVIRFLAK